MSSLFKGSAGPSRPTNETGIGQAMAASSGMRTPRDIMNQRQAREAKKRAEAGVEIDVREEIRLQEEEETRQRTKAQQEEFRPATERGAGGNENVAQRRESGYRSARGSSGGKSAVEASYSPIRDQPREFAYGQVPTSSLDPPPRRPGAGAVPLTEGARQRSIPPTTAPNPTEADKPKSNVSTFPHAFERWETLSSHWEGLTSYWIRRLEQNTEDIRRDLTTQQMSRQITDLAAAGANLFHAVVELQRLRASSERKFQRWFFETRSQQEHDHGEIARLRDDLEIAQQATSHGSNTELNNRIAELTDANHELDTRSGELRRELQISKDEARRAWEELGRREQEERDRQAALRAGLITYIGGMQVLPVQSALSRDPSQREGGYQGHNSAHAGVGHGEQGYTSYEHQHPSPTDTDPFSNQPPNVRTHATESFQPSPSRVPHSQSLPLQSNEPMHGSMFPGSRETEHPTSQPGTAAQTVMGRFYRQPGSSLHDPSQTGAHAGISGYTSVHGVTSGDDTEDEGYELDEHGNLRYDERGNAIPIRHTGTAPRLEHVTSTSESSDDEYDVGVEAAKEREIAQRYGRSSAGGAGTTAASNPEHREYNTTYEGQEHGGESSWEGQGESSRGARLSDVLEEEDESRSSVGGRRTGAPLY